MMSSGGSRQSGNCIRYCILGFAIALTVSVLGPALYWKVKKGTKLGHYHTSPSCPPCICDCPPPLSMLKISPAFGCNNNDQTCRSGIQGLANLSTEDCGKSDPDLHEEMEKQYAELLMEELKLQEVVAHEHIRHMNASYREARRVASQYQREAEKCTIAIETCEEARERAEALISREMKLSFLWEQRARRMGWEAE